MKRQRSSLKIIRQQNIGLMILALTGAGGTGSAFRSRLGRNRQYAPVKQGDQTHHEKRHADR